MPASDDTKRLFDSIVLKHAAEDKAVAEGEVPEDLELFQDHFPGFPVLPGVLAVNILKETAEMALSRTKPAQRGNGYGLQKIERVRFAGFLRPGDRWESSVNIKVQGDHILCQAQLVHNGKKSVTARFVLTGGQG